MDRKHIIATLRALRDGVGKDAFIDALSTFSTESTAAKKLRDDRWQAGVDASRPALQSFLDKSNASSAALKAAVSFYETGESGFTRAMTDALIIFGMPEDAARETAGRMLTVIPIK